MCCHHPLRAPCDDEHEERIGKLLASSDAGRAHLPILRGGFALERDMRVFKQVDGRCVHLSEPRHSEAGCSLHFLGGLDALSPACRNYPRWVTRLPSEPGSETELEALFVVACPTAAALVVADPSPFRFVEVPVASWLYPPTRETPAEELDKVRALRAGWWELLAEGRDDPERLLAVLAAMYSDPCHAPRSVTAGPPPGRFLKALHSYDVRFASDALERMPERGSTYGERPFELWRDMTRDISARELLDEFDIAPGLLTAFVDHQVPYAGIHDGRPIDDWMRATVRRTLAIARMADSLIARVPFGIDTLFADLFGAAMLIEAMGAPVDD